MNSIAKHQPHKNVTMAVVIFTAMLLSSALFCQANSSADESFGALKGVVSDKNGAVIVKATVTIKNKKFAGKLQTDDSGEFETKLPEGIYTIGFEQPGFYRLTLADVLVRPRYPRELKVHLELEPPIGLVPIKDSETKIIRRER